MPLVLLLFYLSARLLINKSLLIFLFPLSITMLNHFFRPCHIVRIYFRKCFTLKYFCLTKVFSLYQLFFLIFVKPFYQVFFLLSLIHYFYDYLPCKAFFSFYFAYFQSSVLLSFKYLIPPEYFPSRAQFSCTERFPLKF